MDNHALSGRDTRGDVRRYGRNPRVSEPLPVTGGSRLALPLPVGDGCGTHDDTPFGS